MDVETTEMPEEDVPEEQSHDFQTSQNMQSLLDLASRSLEEAASLPSDDLGDIKLPPTCHNQLGPKSSFLCPSSPELEYIIQSLITPFYYICIQTLTQQMVAQKEENGRQIKGKEMKYRESNVS